MASIWRVFQQCGWPSWLSLLLGLCSLAFAAVALGAALFRARAAVLLSWSALALALLPAGVGTIGMALLRAKVDRLLAEEPLDPSQIVSLRREGYEEAAGCVTLGGALSGLPFVLAVIALPTAYTLRRRAEPAGTATRD